MTSSSENTASSTQFARLPITRRRNLQLQLAKWMQEQTQSAGEATSTAFAQAIGVHKSLLSKLKAAPVQPGQPGAEHRDISDKLARQIEANLGLAPGWMDIEHEDAPLTGAEESFLEVALAAYRMTDAKGRAELRKIVKGWPAKS